MASRRDVASTAAEMKLTPHCRRISVSRGARTQIGDDTNTRGQIRHDAISRRATSIIAFAITLLSLKIPGDATFLAN